MISRSISMVDTAVSPRFPTRSSNRSPLVRSPRPPPQRHRSFFRTFARSESELSNRIPGRGDAFIRYCMYFLLTLENGRPREGEHRSCCGRGLSDGSSVTRVGRHRRTDRHFSPPPRTDARWPRMEWNGMKWDGTEFYGQNRRFEIFSGILVGERGGGRSLSGQDPLVFSGEGYCPLEVSIRLRDIYGGPVQ